MFTLIGKKGFGVMVRYQEEDREKDISEGAKKIQNNKSQMQDFADLERIKLQLDNKGLDPKAKLELDFLQKNLERKVAGLDSISVKQQCNDFFEANDYLKNNKTKIIEETKARLAKGENVSEFPHLAAVFLIQAEAIKDTVTASVNTLKDSILETQLITDVKTQLNMQLKLSDIKDVIVIEKVPNVSPVIKTPSVINVSITRLGQEKVDLGSIALYGSDGLLKNAPTIANEVQTKIERMKDNLLLEGNKKFIERNKGILGMITEKIKIDGLEGIMDRIYSNPTKEEVNSLNKLIKNTNETGSFNEETLSLLKKLAGLEKEDTASTVPAVNKIEGKRRAPRVDKMSKPKSGAQTAPKDIKPETPHKEEVVEEADNRDLQKTISDITKKYPNGIFTISKSGDLQYMANGKVHSMTSGVNSFNEWKGLSQEIKEIELRRINGEITRLAKQKEFETQRSSIMKAGNEFMDNIINNPNAFKDFIKASPRGGTPTIANNPFSTITWANGKYAPGAKEGDLQMKDNSLIPNAFEGVIKDTKSLEAWRGMSDSQKSDIITALNAEWNKKAKEKLTPQAKTTPKK